LTTIYFDTSALVKRYLTEIGSRWVSSLVQPGMGNTIMVAEITRVEVAAALAARHRAPGGISQEERDKAVDLLLSHSDAEYRIVPLTRPIVGRAVTLTQQYRLRGYDAVQLATAVITNETLAAVGLTSLTFVAADNDLLMAAHAEGLAAENPNDHP
jgi:uncharacterized protein